MFKRELGGMGAKDACAVVKRKLSIAGRDYAHETICLACFAGGGSGGSMRPPASGALIGCRLCPMAFHRGCARHLGCQEAHGQVGGITFTCPQHACGTCARKAPAAGGMLFRCEACPATFCEDCLPREAVIVGGSARLEARGVRMPSHGCYIRCSPRCDAFMQRSAPLATEMPPFEPLELDDIGAEGVGAATATAAAVPQESGTVNSASEEREAAGVQLLGEEDAGSSFAKLFGTVVAARKAAVASTAAFFEAELRATLLARVTIDEQGEPLFVLKAAGRAQLTRRLGTARGRNAKGIGSEQLIAGAIACGTLLRHGHDGGDLAASPALAASLRRALEEEEAAQEALLAGLVKRVRGGILQAARNAAPSSKLGRLEWTINISRLGKRFGQPFCRLGYDCSAVESMVREAHVCSLFASEEERELCPAVFARLCEEGTLSPVRAESCEIVAGGVFDPFDEHHHATPSTKQWCGFTVARTESVAHELAELAERKAAQERAQAEEQWQKQARRDDAQRKAEQELTRMRARFPGAPPAPPMRLHPLPRLPDRVRNVCSAPERVRASCVPELVEADHDELLEQLKPLLRLTSEEMQAAGLLSVEEVARRIGCTDSAGQPSSALGKWLGRDRHTAHIPQNPATVERVEGLVRKWLKRRPERALVTDYDSPLETRTQLQQALLPFVFPALHTLHGLTHPQMAALLGVSRSSFYNWVHGIASASTLAEVDESVRMLLLRRAAEEAQKVQKAEEAEEAEKVAAAAATARLAEAPETASLPGAAESSSSVSSSASTSAEVNCSVDVAAATATTATAEVTQLVDEPNLLPGWSAWLHVTATGRRYKTYRGPAGKKAASQADMRRVAGCEAPSPAILPSRPAAAKKPLAKPSSEAEPSLKSQLRAFMSTNGYSQKEIGQLLQTSASSVSNWINSVRQSPDAVAQIDARVAALLES